MIGMIIETFAWILTARNESEASFDWAMSIFYASVGLEVLL
jgi:hypothetical protein